ncbi:DNA-directed RNA polymerase III subunit RPC4 [Bienertia sinuspersici]
MDPSSFDRKPNAPRKVRFQPKAPVRKAAKPVAAKTEVVDDAESEQAKNLMRRYQDGLASKPKIEKKSEHVQRVAFGYGSSIPSSQYSASNGTNSRYQDKTRFSNQRENEEYKEPWNYYSYYPVTLPLRRPYSGDPAVLDSEEFGRKYTFDESESNTAKELGLMVIRNAAATEQAPASSSKPASVPNPTEKVAGLNDLQAGVMGKMLVYKSGAVKLKLGDTLYDVSPGSDCTFAQDVVAINVEEKHCCVIGELNKRATITPDVNSILESFSDLG